MSRRIAGIGLCIVLLAGLASAITVACYNPPKPACGFICGSGGACPEDYTCGADHRCHLNGTTEVCAPVDAAIDARPIDGPPDAAADAPPADAAVDAPPPADAPDDALPADASDDAPPVDAAPAD